MKKNVLFLLACILLMSACDGLKAVTKVTLQQLPKREVRVSDLFPDDKKAQRLASAASEGQVDLVDKLIAEGANPNAVGEHGITVLGWLLYRPNITGLKRLLKHGADPNVIWTKWDESRGWEWSFIHLATELSPKIGVEHLKAALDMGGEPNLIVENYNNRPILLADEPNNREAFVALVNAGANVDYIDPNGESLLQDAETNRNYELVYFLLKEDINYMYESGRYEWIEEFAQEKGLDAPWPDIWCRLIHDFHIDINGPSSDMWYWRCVDFLEKKGMNFAIPAKYEKLRPLVLDTKPTFYELETKMRNIKD